MQTETINETSQLKPWDYVTYIPGDKDIAGLVVMQEGDNVWMTNISDDCQIIIVKRDLLWKSKCPSLFWNFTWGDRLAKRFGENADFYFTLYPSESCREDAISWRSYELKAMAMGITVYREHIGRDHYHYYIPGLNVFCNQDYA
jgi:hypothetical protein